jgi:hypothetical protein
MWWWVALAAAMEPVEGLIEVEAPVLYRVEDPDHPLAVARSLSGSVLEQPPAEGGWSYEPIPVLDGYPDKVALDVLNADLWHEAGYRGQGVRVAIFDLHWFGSQADPSVLGEVETADCWTHSSCEAPMDTERARFANEEGVHGYACAEIVREVAPEAEIFLVRVNGLTTFENAVQWAIRNDIDLISMSMSFFNSSFYDGTGSFMPPMDELAAAGVLLVTSAGNYAREHWSGPWRDVDGDGQMDFEGANHLEIDMTAGSRRTVYVNWDEHRRCGDSDLDAFIYDDAGNLVGASEEAQDRRDPESTEDPDKHRCSPVERVSAYVSETGRHRLVLRADRLVSAGLEVDIFTQNGTIVGARPEFSIADPSPHPWAYTVAAVRADGYLTNNVESFSSWGPVRSGAFKPDVAGPDGLTATAYGATGFFGTSAATPAVTGALALIMSRDRSLSPWEAGSRLRSWAWSEGSADYDPRWGAGKARLPVPDPVVGGCGGSRMAGMFLLLPWGLRHRRRAPRRSDADR